ncbi:MAG: glycine cleavage system aminomethyltransferase GcvT [Pseudomonadota bacterium]
MLKKTALHAAHIESGGKLVDFGGWEMPLHYGSQLEEHHVVRQAAGVFDVSHMTVVDIEGEADQPRQYLRRLLANDIDKAKTQGQAVYTCMLNEAGGVVDDLIAYWRGGNHFRLVVNAATRDKDLAWMQSQAEGFNITLTERPQLAMLAVQGPEARSLAASVLPEALREPAQALKPFHAAEAGDWFVARTGYTGEDGWEIILPEAAVAPTWAAIIEQGIRPCGLGARDTLRLEAGLNLYGSDMDESTPPDTSNLGWTLALGDDRDFVGRAAVEAARSQGIAQQLTGLLLESRGVLRDHQEVVSASGEALGEITSGGYGPTLERSIALARIASDAGDTVHVKVRNKLLTARVVPPPFVRRGTIKVEI